VQPASLPRDPTAVVGRRVVATIIDTIIFGVLYAFVWQSQAEYVRVPSGLDYGDVCDQLTTLESASQCLQIGDRAYFVTGGTAAAMWVGGFLAGLLIYVVLQGLTGWTPGKLIMGIRAVSEDGSPPGLGRAALRWILLVVDYFPYCLPLVGLITALATKGHRRVGDMVAKTFVVSSRDAGSPIMVPGVTAPQGAMGYGQPAWGGAPPPPGGGWSPPTQPTTAGWAAPGQQPPSPPPSSSPPEAASPTATADGPQWDEARGTYIQWDADQSTWLQWDEDSRSWSPIPGQ
jgi:hypothetical protein